MSDSNESECVICLDSLHKDVKVLACSHRLHKTCLEEYKEFHGESKLYCPLCKHEIVETYYCMKICHVLLVVFCVFGSLCTCVYLLSALIS